MTMHSLLLIRHETQDYREVQDVQDALFPSLSAKGQKEPVKSGSFGE